jgi:DHA1 family inner membrane transport protein
MTEGISQRFSIIQSIAVISMGVIAGCVIALQPLLLGGLLEQDRLTAAQLGQSATAEAMGMAVAVTLAAMLLKPSRLKPFALAAIAVAVIANSCTGLASGIGIIILRALNGLCSGTLLWVLLGFMARAAVPGRIFAVYVTAQAVVTFIFSLLLSNWLLPVFGATAGYLMFAVADLLLLLAVVAMPVSYNVDETQSAWVIPPLKGVLGLLSVGFFLAAVLGFWVYVLPLGKQLGYPGDGLSFAVSMAIGIQIIAGISAVILASRLRPLAACLGGAILMIVAIVAFLAMSGTLIMYFALSMFAFIWMFVPPFQMPLLIELDPSLRSALFIGTAQLLGVAVGPIIASQLITESSLTPAAHSAIGCAVASIGLMFAARYLKTGSAA